ncbi:hypothetical protein L195_g039493, partial [Trifolium pratense]
VDSLDAKVLDVIQRLWRTDIPSKIKIFGWRKLRTAHIFSFRADSVRKYGAMFSFGFDILFNRFGDLFKAKDNGRDASSLLEDIKLFLGFGFLVVMAVMLVFHFLVGV